MSNLSPAEAELLREVHATLHSTLSHGWQALADFGRVLQLDQTDDANIATKPAVKASVVRLRQNLVSAITYIDEIKDTLPTNP